MYNIRIHIYIYIFMYSFFFFTYIYIYICTYLPTVGFVIIKQLFSSGGVPLPPGILNFHTLHFTITRAA